MSDYATARSVRDASRTITFAIVLSAVFMTVTLPIVSVIVVDIAARWRLESVRADLEKAVDEQAATEGR